MTPRHAYIARINRVIDHIDTHLADTLGLVSLAEVAHFSPWHFHRVFQAITGETLAERVRRRRLEVAASRLLAAPPAPAGVVGLDVGFGSAEVFTRAFRAHFGVTPTAWRQGAWRDWAEHHRALLSKIHQDQRQAHQAVQAALRDDARRWAAGPHLGTGGVAMEVELRTLPGTRVAYLRHIGPYGSASISRMWQRFGAWCAQRGLMAAGRTMVGISQDSPDLTAPDKCRYDACIEVDEGFKAESEVGVQTVIGGRYACSRFVGTAGEILAAWMRLFGEWLPDSGYQCDDRPGLELYEGNFWVDEKAGRFACLLCAPVRPL